MCALRLAALFPLLLFPAQAAAQSRAATDAAFLADYQRARSALEVRNYSRAMLIMEDLLERNQDDGDLYYGLGMAYLRERRNEPALGYLMTAFEAGFSANDYNLAYTIAGVHARLGAREEALTWLHRALELRHVDRPGVAMDAVFSSLRADPRFAELAGMAPDSERTREEAWQYDLDFLMSEIRRMNPRPGGHPDGGPVHTAIESLKGRVSKLDDGQMIFELMEVVALLGDGHSGIRLSTDVQASFLPVQFYVFSDGLFIIRGTGAGEGLIGSKVLSIGGHGADSLLEAISVVVPHENSQGVVANGPFYLRSPELLYHLGLSSEPHSLILELEKPDGERATVELQGEAMQRFSSTAPPTESPNPVPRYLRNTGAAFWSERLADLDAVYVQFNGVQDMPGKSLAQFARDLHGELVASAVHNVIVDVRHNGGGNNFLVKPMIRTLVHFELEEQGNRVFVITSRRTYSACQNFLNRLEQVGEPIVVGEPSSSKPNFIGESTQVRLPFSGLRFGISSRYWQDSFPEDSRPWIAPQLPVRLSSGDWFGNRDPAMAAIREVIGANRN